jgi:hypothetical protein
MSVRADDGKSVHERVKPLRDRALGQINRKQSIWMENELSCHVRSDGLPAG